MTVRPQPKVIDLIQSLEPHMVAGKVDPFTLKRFKREAVANMHADPFAGHLALAMIATLEWDEESVYESYRSAIAIRDNAFAHAHFGNFLMLVGRYDEALKELQIAIRMEPGNLTYIRKAIESAKAAGRFKEAIKLHTLLAQRAPGQDSDIEEAAMTLSAVLQANGISEDVVAQCNSIAFSILRRNRLRFVRTRIEADSQDNYIMFYIDIDADEDVVQKLDEELGVELFDKVPDFHPDKYWVGYAKGHALE